MADVRNLGKNHGKNKVYVRDLGVNHVKNFLRKDQGTNLGTTLFVWEEVWGKNMETTSYGNKSGKKPGKYNIAFHFLIMSITNMII